MTKEEAIKEIEEYLNIEETDSFVRGWKYAMLAGLETITRIDDSSIVRCKDCRYMPSTRQYDDSCWCRRRRGYDEDWFCADGKNR